MKKYFLIFLFSFFVGVNVLAYNTNTSVNVNGYLSNWICPSSVDFFMDETSETFYGFTCGDSGIETLTWQYVLDLAGINDIKYINTTGAGCSGLTYSECLATNYAISYGNLNIGSANTAFTTFGNSIVNSSVDLTTTVFTTYWPYVLIISIIGGLIFAFKKIFNLVK